MCAPPRAGRRPARSRATSSSGESPSSAPSRTTWSRCWASSSSRAADQGPESCRDRRALAVLRHDDALALELEIGALDGDHADAEGDGELADRRDLLPGGQSPIGDALLDLLHDLQVHRPSIGLRNDEPVTHICCARLLAVYMLSNILCIHESIAESICGWFRRSRKGRPRSSGHPPAKAGGLHVELTPYSDGLILGLSMPKARFAPGWLNLLVLKVLSRRPGLHGYAIMLAMENVAPRCCR